MVYKTEGVNSKCVDCGRVYIYFRSKGHGKNTCGSCKLKARRVRAKAELVKYKGGSCEECGYNKCMRALSFHHKDPLLKSFALSGSKVVGIKKMKEEADKCELLCANCHMEKHELLDKVV